MTKTLGTNAKNDIYRLTNGNISLLSNRDAVLAACATAAKSQLGEMIFATDKGIPNFQSVWNGKPNIAMFESYLRTTLSQVDGVKSIETIETKVVENTLTYRVVINSVYGAGSING